jgi:hypothetical protein
LEGVEPSPLETEKEWEEQPVFGTTKLIDDWINQISDWIMLDARENTLFSSDIISLNENHQKLKSAMREEQAQRHFINEMIRLEFPYVRIGPWQRLQFWRKDGRLAYNKRMQATSIALTPPTKSPKTAVPMTHITNVMPTDLLTPNYRPVISRQKGTDASLTPSQMLLKNDETSTTTLAPAPSAANRYGRAER